MSQFLFSSSHSLQRKAAEVRARRSDLKKIEDLGATLEEHLILDNRYTEHSTVGLAQAWDQLDQLGMRMQHNLEQQIQARNQSGVSEDVLKEFSMMFKYVPRSDDSELEAVIHHVSFSFLFPGTSTKISLGDLINRNSSPVSGP